VTLAALSLAGWIGVGLVVVVIAAIGIAIWGYPRDGSF